MSTVSTLTKIRSPAGNRAGWRLVAQTSLAQPLWAILLFVAMALTAVAGSAQTAPADQPGTPQTDDDTASSESDEAGAGEAPPTLALLATQVVPATPAAETLCRLRVVLENQGDRAASALRFRVALDGVPLTVYDRQLFVETLPPGEVTRVDLFNFWTSETDRPPPADGSLEVEVTLESARYLQRDIADDGTEILTLQEAIPGLPISLSLSVPIAPEG